MAQFVNIYPCDLRKGPVETSLKHMYLGDVEANRVGVNVTDGGEAVALSGTCSGTAILCNGGTVALTGVISGNQAYIDMPAAVYTVEGPVEIYLAVTTSGVTTTLLHGHGNAVRTDSGIVIDPGTIIPSVSALISDIDAAVASIPEDYSELSADVVQLKSDMEDVQPAVETLEDDVADLKGAVAELPDNLDSDADDVDLDITDDDGNVILRIADGHIKTSKFSSDNPMRASKTDASDVDLDISDGNGNVILRLSDGNIITRDFDSHGVNELKRGSLPRARPTSDSGVDLDITDEAGNVLVRFKNGYMQTSKTDNTDPFEVPSYYFPYLDEKCDRIKELLEASGGDAFIFCTDQHFNQGNAGNSFKLIHYVAEKCRINKLFMGGDLNDGYDGPHSDQYRRAIGGRYYFINGNHEYMANGSTPEILAYLNEATVDDLMMGDTLRNYYYVDNPKKQMRYIVLNGFEATGSTWEQGYEADQITWLTDVAMEIPDGWHMIILSHIFYGVTAMDNPELKRVTWAEPVLTAIDASDNASSVLCVVCGHTHVDGIESTDGGIPVLVTTCDKNKRYNPGAGYEWWITNRDDGTVKEQAFDVCIIDLTHSKITAVRIGGFTTGDADDDAALFTTGERVINL